jgi:hypothetical protein
MLVRAGDVVGNEIDGNNVLGQPAEQRAQVALDAADVAVDFPRWRIFTRDRPRATRPTQSLDDAQLEEDVVKRVEERVPVLVLGLVAVRPVQYPAMEAAANRALFHVILAANHLEARLRVSEPVRGRSVNEIVEAA